MKNLKYYVFMCLLFSLKFSVLFSQNNTDSSKVKSFVRDEVVDKNFYYNNSYFSFLINTVDYSKDTVVIDIKFKNKSKKQCYINIDIYQQSSDGDTLPWFSNLPLILSEHSSWESYRLKLLELNEGLNCKIKIEKKHINCINLNLAFFYKIEDVLSKFPNKAIDTKKVIVLQGYLGSDYEGIGMQKIMIQNFPVNGRGIASIYFSGID